MALAVKKFGGLDILVNNAAILRDAFVFKLEPRDWEAVIQTNLSAAAFMTAAATPVLRDNAKAARGGNPYGWGRIVNIVSTAGLYGNYGQAAYAGAKAGLVGLTRVDGARHGARRHHRQRDRALRRDARHRIDQARQRRRRRSTRRAR